MYILYIICGHIEIPVIDSTFHTYVKLDLLWIYFRSYILWQIINSSMYTWSHSTNTIKLKKNTMSISIECLNRKGYFFISCVFIISVETKKVSTPKHERDIQKQLLEKISKQHISQTHHSPPCYCAPLLSAETSLRGTTGTDTHSQSH